MTLYTFSQNYSSDSISLTKPGLSSVLWLSILVFNLVLEISLAFAAISIGGMLRIGSYRIRAFTYRFTPPLRTWHLTLQRNYSFISRLHLFVCDMYMYMYFFSFRLFISQCLSFALQLQKGPNSHRIHAFVILL